jgi:hypothetical protein
MRLVLHDRHPGGFEADRARTELVGRVDPNPFALRKIGERLRSTAWMRATSSRGLNGLGM